MNTNIFILLSCLALFCCRELCTISILLQWTPLQHSPFFSWVHLKIDTIQPWIMSPFWSSVLRPPYIQHSSTNAEFCFSLVLFRSAEIVEPQKNPTLSYFLLTTTTLFTKHELPPKWNNKNCVLCANRVPEFIFGFRSNSRNRDN